MGYKSSEVVECVVRLASTSIDAFGRVLSQMPQARGDTRCKDDGLAWNIGHDVNCIQLRALVDPKIQLHVFRAAVRP